MFIFANQTTPSIADIVMKILMFLPLIFWCPNLETLPPQELKENSSRHLLDIDNYKEKKDEVANFF
ncbi:MAG: hypothetical protein AAGJ08_29735 [Cyanobacteria bacterium P01_H01_bin.35]